MAPPRKSTQPDPDPTLQPDTDQTPAAGGSYIRQPDGSLTRVDGVEDVAEAPTAPAGAAPTSAQE